MQLLSGVILLLSAAGLMVAAQTYRLPLSVSLVVLLLLAPAGLAVIFGADEKAKALVAKWWERLKAWFAGQGGWSLWEAVTLGVVVFGLFAGPVFLQQPLTILAGILAPWLAGLWASRRGSQWPALVGPLAGAIVGMIEGAFFLQWLPPDWQVFPSWLLVVLLVGLIGAALGFWAFARGKMRFGGGE